MTETEIRKIRQQEWLKQHTLTQEQRNQLFLNKLARAQQSSQALKQRERRVFDRA